MVAATRRLYANFKDGFAGYELKDGEFITSCSDIDNILVVRKDGTYFITKVAPKFYVGKNVIYIGVFKKGDTATVYNVAYRDGATGYTYVKRFNITGLTRDKEYNLTKGAEHSEILYFSVTKGEAEIVQVKLKPKPRLKKKVFEFDFGQLPVRSRNAQGNILTKHAVHKIVMKERGQQTVGVKLWFDWQVMRLKNTETDYYLGEFTNDDTILVVTKRGTYYMAPADLSHHFPEDIKIIEKYDPQKVYNVVYYNAEQNAFYLKRFVFEPVSSETSFLSNGDSYLVDMQPGHKVIITFTYRTKDRKTKEQVIDADEFLKVKSISARGKKLTDSKLLKVDFVQVQQDEQADDQTGDKSLFDQEGETE